MFKDLITNIFCLLAKRQRISAAEDGVYFDTLIAISCGDGGAAPCKDFNP